MARGIYPVHDYVDPRVKRPLLKALRDGGKYDMSPAEALRVMREAEPVLRKGSWPPVPVNPKRLPWLIIGGAPDVRADINAAPPTGPRIAINRAALDFEHDVAATLHPEITQAMAEKRTRLVCPTATDWVTDTMDSSGIWSQGTSALYAVAVALALGAAFAGRLPDRRRRPLPPPRPRTGAGLA